MTGKNVFDVVSDEDSITTDSTAESDTQDTYEVEKILAEELSIDTGVMEYLVKWAGYPLDQCTWEPHKHFNGDNILVEWSKHKQLIREGKEKPFDVDDFATAVENRLAEQALRKRRRRIKRRKRGIPVSAHESDAEPPAPKSAGEATGGKSVSANQLPMKRKGIARKLERRRAKNPSSESSSEGSTSENDSSGNDSMVEELKTVPARKISQPEPKKSTYTGTAVMPRKDQDGSSKPQTQAPNTMQPPTPTGSITARKSAPITGGIGFSKRTTGKDLSTNWTAEKKGRQRARVSGDTARGYEQPRFKSLSEQNRYQKYSRNEPAPDFSALNVIDPKTGKVLPKPGQVSKPADVPKPSSPALGVAPTAEATRKIPSAYQRRTPPPEARPRSATPPAPEPAPVARPSTNVIPTRTGAIIPGAGYVHRYQQTTCWYWLDGHCQYDKDTCRFAHWHIPSSADKEREPLPQVSPQERQASPPGPRLQAREYTRQKELTCYFWKRGHCTKSEAECHYAHRDTGVDAPPPYGGFKKASRGVMASGTHLDGAGTVTYDSAALRPALLQGSAPTNAATANRDVNLPRTLPTLQTDVNNTSMGSASPMLLTMSPVNANLTRVENGTRSTQNRPMPPSRRPSAPASIMKAKLEISYKDKPSTVQVKLEISNHESISRFVGNEPTVRVEQMIMASDFETLIWDDALRAIDSSSGGIMPDFSPSAELESVTELCKLHGCGLVARVGNRDARMLIYPSSAEEWKLLDQGSIPLTVDSVLRFRLFSQLPALLEKQFGGARQIPEPLDMRSCAAIVGKELVGLERERLLPKDIKHVFLMMPTTHLVELELYTKIFQSMGCYVYHSGSPGAWSYFCKCKGKSLVLMHPDVPAWQIPGLHDQLFSAGNVLFFVLGVDRPSALLEDRPARFGCTRMFPHGTVLFITDDVWQYHPERATAIIHNFMDQHGPKPEGADYSRIAARPGVKDFVARLAEQKSQDRDRRGDNRWSDLHDALCYLFPPDAEDPWNPGTSLPHANLISISPDLLPSFEGLWERDETAATDFMVEWFAGWCVLNASRFRKFIVCHEPDRRTAADQGEDVDPRGWARKYQHLGVMSVGSVIGRVFPPQKKKAHR